MQRLVVCAALALAPFADAAFNVGVQPRRAIVGVSARRAPAPRAGFLEDAWAKYVLLRPGMTYDELKESTLRSTTEQFKPTLDKSKRTPGTVRTVLLSSVVVCLAAVPALAQNPAVLAKLIELASLDRVGVTPIEMLEKTGSLW
eukprot:2383777-Prymnesium_polylepis.2